jgi:flavin-binding protein dodecin
MKMEVIHSSETSVHKEIDGAISQKMTTLDSAAERTSIPARGISHYII